MEKLSVAYKIETCSPSDISAEDKEECIKLISNGGAVGRRYVEENLPKAQRIAVTRCDNTIVGVGVIKQIRCNYTKGIADKSGHSFPSDTHELGYISIHEKHRSCGLSGYLVTELLSTHSKPLFATTSSEPMKKTLKKRGFLEKGKKWSGKNGCLTLWIYDPSVISTDPPTGHNAP